MTCCSRYTVGGGGGGTDSRRVEQGVGMYGHCDRNLSQLWIPPRHDTPRVYLSRAEIKYISLVNYTVSGSPGMWIVDVPSS